MPSLSIQGVKRWVNGKEANMAGTCIECGRTTHGTNQICYGCSDPGEHNDEFAQSTQRREFQKPYAVAQENRVKGLQVRIQAEEAEMRRNGLDPNKH